MSTKGFAVNLQSNISKVSYSSQVQTVSEAEQQNSFSSIMSQTQNTEEDKSLVPCATSNISEKKQVKKYENDYAVSQSNSQLRDSAKNGSIQTKELTVKETGTEELSYEAKLKETLMKVLGVSEEELEEMTHKRKWLAWYISCYRTVQKSYIMKTRQSLQIQELIHY